MTLDQIRRTDVSLVTRKAIKERLDHLAKSKGVGFISFSKLKKGRRFNFSSIATYSKDRYKIIIDIENKNCSVFCSCEAFTKQGYQYRATQLKSSVFAENRPDKRWRNYHADKSILCKHLWILLVKQKAFTDNILLKHSK
jgi:hypothetical protein